jgi:hypothetical protein
MKRTLTTMVVVCVCLAGGGGAWADDLAQFQPPWRGDAGSTYQQWTFGTNSRTVVADTHWEECEGNLTDPVATISPTAGYSMNFAGRTGQWILEEPHGEMIVLDIDNCDLPNPEKYIWMQVTYFVGAFYQDQPYSEPLIDVLAGEAMVTDISSGQTAVVGDVGYGQWIVELYKFRIEPNPISEEIRISPPPGPQGGPQGMSRIDQVVVDTICIPEPATMGLLALGGVAMLRRQRGRGK